MKKVTLATIAIIFSALISGCATNFATLDSWKDDKKGEHFAAEVLTSEAKSGFIEGTAKIISTGEVVKYIQKPYLTTTLPFQKGVVIFVAK